MGRYIPVLVPKKKKKEKETKVIPGIEFLQRKAVTQRVTQRVGFYFDKQSRLKIKLLKLRSGKTSSEFSALTSLYAVLCVF